MGNWRLKENKPIQDVTLKHSLIASQLSFTRQLLKTNDKCLVYKTGFKLSINCYIIMFSCRDTEGPLFSTFC